ncbi:MULTISPECIES: FAD-dependent monooxygenase [Streptomyces]|uniref:Monooxygenase n=1 Tax=Streptomyces rhizosphaericus TaxID=114699 RepID=A0A6G4AUI0_9ACTN|nr:FAD-dependent monooxygenase [Streptomyces rhizosphaericus]NEW76900.1 monooxygenase [Streptomyces rhizosphaericus]
MVSDRQKVLVSGAGAAGQTLAYWLARHGFETTVVERAPAPRIGGFAIDLRGTAVHVAERMGIIDAVRANRVHMKEIVHLDHLGEPVWKTDGNFGAGEGLTGDVEILRDDLTSLLGRACAELDGLTYRFNDSIESIDQTGDHVEVAFEKSPPGRFDLVLGADGLHSTVRALTFEEAEAYKKRLGYYAAIFSIPNIFGMERQMFMSSLPGKLVIVLQYGLAKHTRGMLVFASPPLEFDKWDADEQKALIRGAFKDDHAYWAVAPLLAELDQATDLYFDEVTQITMPAWSSGRVALVGDAAFAPTTMSGQGTSTAVVGAYVLAGELKAAGGDPTVAFPRYEAKVRPYVELNQAIPFESPELAIPSSWEGIEQRNAEVLDIMTRQGHGTTGAGETAGDIITRAANAIELDSY